MKNQRNSSRTVRRVLGIGLVSALCLSPQGCANKHGTHTSQLRTQAADRVAQMKAATDFDMAQQQFLAGDLEKAFRSVEKSIGNNPKVARSHVLRGRILIEQGRLEPALVGFAAALEIEPEHAEAHYYSGIVYERFSKYDLALREYDLASKADPTNPQYVIASAEMLIDQGKLGEARVRLETCKDSHANNPGIRQSLGHLAMLEQRHDDAVRYFNEAVLLAPDDPTLAEDLARAQLVTRQFGEAELNLRRAMSTPEAAGRVDLVLLRSECLVELERPVEARELLVNIVEQPGGDANVNAWKLLGSVAALLNDEHRLREAASRLRALAPDEPHGYTLMAVWQRSKGQLLPAIKTLDRAIALSKDDPAPATLQGLIYAQLQMPREAAESFKRAQRLDPKDPQVRALLEQQTQALAGAPVSSDY